MLFSSLNEIMKWLNLIPIFIFPLFLSVFKGYSYFITLLLLRDSKYGFGGWAFYSTIANFDKIKIILRFKSIAISSICISITLSPDAFIIITKDKSGLIDL